eukprot:5892387-Karenia_brevis.AAC.1
MCIRDRTEAYVPTESPDEVPEDPEHDEKDEKDEKDPGTTENRLANYEVSLSEDEDSPVPVPPPKD